MEELLEADGKKNEQKKEQKLIIISLENYMSGNSK